MEDLNSKLEPIRKRMIAEDERHRDAMDALRAEQERVTQDHYKERNLGIKKNFTNRVKSLRTELLKDPRVVSVLQSRKPFAIAIEKTGDLPSIDLLRMVKRETGMTWVQEKSGIPNLCMLNMSEKEMPKLEP